MIRAVTGLRGSEPHHWLNARGVVDGDGRTEEEQTSLRERGILTLPVSEVENLYYSDAVMKAVAARQAESIGEMPVTLLSQARAAALKALREEGAPERFAKALALGVSRRRVLEELPTSVDASATSITVIFPSPYPEMLSRIAALLDSDDLDGLTRLVPIRDTAMRDRVARALRFRNFVDYEAAARALIRKDEILADGVRALIGPMPS